MLNKYIMDGCIQEYRNTEIQKSESQWRVRIVWKDFKDLVNLEPNLKHKKDLKRLRRVSQQMENSLNKD